MKMLKTIILIFFILSLFSYSDNNSETDFNHSQWKKSIIKSRTEKDNEFKTSPTSPMSGLIRTTVNHKEEIFVYLINGNIKTSTTSVDDFILKIYKKDKKWISEDNKDNKNIRDKSRETFNLNRFTFMCYPSVESFTLIIFDPLREMQKNFSHLLYYPPDPKFRVRAKLERFKKINKITVKTSRELEKQLLAYARVHFIIDGKELKLTAFKFTLDKKSPYSKYLFLPFFDKTNMTDTYEAGRFLEAIEPEGDEIIIDFNECYNPLCNYAPVYNCTLPPFENELDIEIKAGEKTYPH
ncbi:MAG: DUF1684 domain-containing protein [Acidobacteriota bacterium]